MENRDIKSLARHYNTKRKTISKWLIIAAIIIGAIGFLFHSNVFVMPIALIISFALNIIIFYGAKAWAKSYCDKYNDPELYRAILIEGYGRSDTSDGSSEKVKKKHIFNFKHLLVFVIACAIGPTILFIKNKADNSMTLKMKDAVSTQYKNFEYIDYLHIMKNEKRIDTLCFFRTEEYGLTMSSLITFDEDKWYVFMNFGSVYDGFSNIYVDPHYNYMTDIYVCGDSSQVPENAYLTYEIDELYLYIGNIVELSDYESDVWYGAMITGASRSFELEALLTARAVLEANLSEFDILELGWIRDDWRFADYLCIYGTSENELNAAVFIKNENKDINGLYATYEGLKVGETYYYTDSDNKYTIGYGFYENKLDVPKNACYTEELQVKGRDLWLGVISVKSIITE